MLLDDDFSSIVEAIKMGRRIFDNLKKAMAYIFAIHVPIAGMSLLPLIFGWPLVFLPVHIVFLELIIDPACSVVFESERAEQDLMLRPPRPSKESLFGKKIIGLSLLQGFSVLAIVMAVFFIALSRGQGEEGARALSFGTLIVANLCLIMTRRPPPVTRPRSRARRAPPWMPARPTLGQRRGGGHERLDERGVQVHRAGRALPRRGAPQPRRERTPRRGGLQTRDARASSKRRTIGP